MARGNCDSADENMSTVTGSAAGYAVRPFHCHRKCCWLCCQALSLSQEVLLVMLSGPFSETLLPLLLSEQNGSVSPSCLTLRPRGLQPARLLCPWGFPGKKTAMCSHSLLQGIFPTQGLNLGLLLCRQILYHLSRQGSLLIIPTKDCS